MEDQRIDTAENHAALRRVATLVARQLPPRRLAAAIAREIAAMPGVAGVTVERLGESPALLASLGDDR